MSAYPSLHCYSFDPIAEVVSVEQPEKQEFLRKPRGLWVSDDDGEPGWAEWCRGEDFGVYRHRYRVVLARPERLLWLDHEGAIRGFAAEYGTISSWSKGSGGPSDRTPDWRRVADAFAGIVITPYCWRLRLELGFMWYYGWDCASGCIWDASVIQCLEPAAMLPPWENEAAIAEMALRQEERRASAEKFSAEFRERGAAMFTEPKPENS